MQQSPTRIAPTPTSLGDPLGRHEAAALLARVAAGDDAALGRLYDAYAVVLCTVATRIVRDATDADEVVLDAFTQAWRDAARYDGSRGSVLAWLVMIARSRALDLVRSRLRGARTIETATRAAPDDPSPAASAWRSDPVSELDQRDQYAVLVAAVNELPPPIRRVVELVLTEALSHSEIAERLGTPLGTVKTRMRTGLRMLRERLGATFRDAWRDA